MFDTWRAMALHDGEQLPLFAGVARSLPARRHPFLYASSASVYGAVVCSRRARVRIAAQRLCLFQIPVRPGGAPPLGEPQFTDRRLRYFNVYGQREQHKARMASVAYHFFNQYRAEGYVKLFEGCDGYANGGSCAISSRWRMWSRSICSSSTIRANPASSISARARHRASTMWRPPHQYAAGSTGRGRADAGADASATAHPLYSVPGRLARQISKLHAGRYLCLREAGYDQKFLTVEQGTARYVNYMLEK